MGEVRVPVLPVAVVETDGEQRVLFDGVRLPWAIAEGGISVVPMLCSGGMCAVSVEFLVSSVSVVAEYVEPVVSVSDRPVTDPPRLPPVSDPGPADRPGTEIIVADHGFVCRAGDNLARAAARVCAEYDGIHRLRSALAEWFEVRSHRSPSRAPSVSDRPVTDPPSEWCGSRGPRIGDEGCPICKLPKGHGGREHRPDDSDGWPEGVYWLDPLAPSVSDNDTRPEGEQAAREAIAEGLSDCRVDCSSYCYGGSIPIDEAVDKIMGEFTAAGLRVQQ